MNHFLTLISKEKILKEKNKILLFEIKIWDSLKKVNLFFNIFTDLHSKQDSFTSMFAKSNLCISIS